MQLRVYERVPARVERYRYCVRDPELIERTEPLFRCDLRPAFQPALFGLLPGDARLVAEPPEQREVGVQLAVEHRLQIELDERLPAEPDVVAQDAESQTV